MELTQEQSDIINSSGDIKINAVAGSGKTTTIIEYARTRPANSKILYLAFNKSVKIDATNKFANQGLKNVTVSTAHSLAYRYVVPRNNYKVRAQGYKIYEIAELLGIEGNGDKHAKYIVANHVSKFVAYFCNSDKFQVQDLDYREVVSDPKAWQFVSAYYEYIEKQTRLFLRKMNNGEIDITHDFYLKKFQLAEPTLNFDYILFDEGQDASAAMLDVFFRQRATKVIVGDTHQQIYGWRFAVNSLEKADFKTFNLTTSFRFSQDIAELALEVLKLKKELSLESPKQIKGIGVSKGLTSKAIIARTNLGLLLKAIEYVTEGDETEQIYFEGNINSYTYADEGASLYDVLNLYNDNHKYIRDKLLKEMKDFDELEEYVENTDDKQLGMMIEVVKKYGNEIPSILKLIKERHIDNDDKATAGLIFSTVHRCKGMEYDSVHLVNDFITKELLEKITLDPKNKDVDFSKLNEEINLLYVAITRTKNNLIIPEPLVPIVLSPSDQISMIHVKDNKSRYGLSETTDTKDLKPRNSMEEIKTRHKKAYGPWTRDLDDELTVLFCNGSSISVLSEHFGRTKGAIRSRIKRLELRDIYG